METDESEREPDKSTIDGLMLLVQGQRDLLVSVATGQSITPHLDHEYGRRRRRITLALHQLGIEDPFPWRHLNDWWAFCSTPRTLTYTQRRAYMAHLAERVLDELERRKSDLGDWSQDVATTWPTLHDRLRGLRVELDRSVALDDWQDVGRRAREILVDAANHVFKESMVPDGDQMPRPNDAKARIDYYLDTRARGRSRADLRKLIRAAWELANSVTHSSGVTRVDAFAAAHATIFIVRMLHEIDAQARTVQAESW